MHSALGFLKVFRVRAAAKALQRRDGGALVAARRRVSGLTLRQYRSFMKSKPRGAFAGCD
jgi:hypothetical protein